MRVAAAYPAVRFWPIILLRNSKVCVEPSSMGSMAPGQVRWADRREREVVCEIANGGEMPWSVMWGVSRGMVGAPRIEI